MDDGEAFTGEGASRSHAHADLDVLTVLRLDLLPGGIEERDVHADGVHHFRAAVRRNAGNAHGCLVGNPCDRHRRAFREHSCRGIDINRHVIGRTGKALLRIGHRFFLSFLHR